MITSAGENRIWKIVTGRREERRDVPCPKERVVCNHHRHKWNQKSITTWRVQTCSTSVLNIVLYSKTSLTATSESRKTPIKTVGLQHSMQPSNLRIERARPLWPQLLQHFNANQKGITAKFVFLGVLCRGLCYYMTGTLYLGNRLMETPISKQR